MKMSSMIFPNALITVSYVANQIPLEHLIMEADLLIFLRVINISGH